MHAVSDATSQRPHTGRTLSILGLAALAYALAQTTVIPAIPDLMSALHTDESGVTWTLTAYLVSAAVFTPLVGRLGDMYGKRRMLVISLLAFSAGSIVAADFFYQERARRNFKAAMIKELTFPKLAGDDKAAARWKK